MSYILASDATLDLTEEQVDKYTLLVVPMAFILDGQEYLHFPDERNLTIEAFYEALRNGKVSATSQINPTVYVEQFRPVLERGEDLLYVCFTSGLSGTYQSALLAKGMLEEEFPERNIIVVDSLCASAGLGFFMAAIAEKKAQGMAMEELEQWILEHRLKVAHWFTVEDLFHLQRGGRLSFAEAMLGSALKIKPVISVNEEGKLYVENKVRGSKKSEEYMIAKINDTMDKTYRTVFVAHGDSEERAQALKEKILEKTEADKVLITKIGPVIGTHTGPGMLAVVFMER